MNILTVRSDERVEAVYFTRDSLIVNLMDGRTISVPLTWYPKLLNASSKERSHWEICGGGYGIHWPEIDEDLSVEGLLRGAPAPRAKQSKKIERPRKVLRQKAVRSIKRRHRVRKKIKAY